MRRGMLLALAMVCLSDLDCLAEMEVRQSPTAVSTRRQSDDLRIERKEYEGLVNRNRKEPALQPELSPPSESRKTPLKKDGSTFLEKAWKAFREGSYPQAQNLFRRALRKGSPEVQKEARLGLAYAHLELGQTQDAFEEFEALARLGYRLQETAPQLLTLLIAMGDYRQAREALEYFPPENRHIWRTRIDAQEEGSRLALARSSEEALIRLAQNDPALLERCGYAGDQLAAGWIWLKKGASEEAARWARSVLACEAAGQDRRLEAIELLSQALGVREGLERLEQERCAFPDFASDSRFDELELRIARRGLEDPVNGDFEKFALAERILRLSPEDDEIRQFLAWNYLQAGRAEAALEAFSALHLQKPQEPAVLSGLLLALKNTGRKDEAMAVLRRSQNTDDSMREIHHGLAMELAALAFEEGNYARSAELAEEALQIRLNDVNALKLLAWSWARLGHDREASESFRRILRLEPSQENARQALWQFRRSEDSGLLEDLLVEIGRSDDPGIRILATEFWIERSQLPKAAAITRNDEACFAGCDSPSFELPFVARFKNGSGAGDLGSYSFPLTVTLPRETGIWRFTGDLTHLSSGESEAADTGTFFNFLENPAGASRSTTDNAIVWAPFLLYRSYGERQWSLGGGLTPIGGPVSPTFTFLARLEKGESWEAQLHRFPVRESLLSIIGQEDPFSSKDWGRVVRTGLAGRRTFALSPDYWLSVEGNFDRWTGENVESNWSAALGASAGRTFRLETGTFSCGLFGRVLHFDENHDHYTFGHGGYFSPDLNLIGGPFAHFSTPLCRPYFLDARLSFGAEYNRIGDAPKYRRASSDALSADEAIADSNAILSGTSGTNLVFSAAIEGFYMFNPKIAAGGGISFQNAEGYSEWHLGLALHLYWEPRRGFCERPLLLGTGRHPDSL